MDRIYVSLDPEVETLLADNEIDLVKALQEQGVDVQGSRAGDPAGGGDGKERELVLVILASAGAFASVAFGISRIIDALGRNKRAIVEERTLEPVVDAEGKPVTSTAGAPVLYWKTTHRMIEPASPQAEKSKVEISAGGRRGLKISLGAGGR